jgi:hypothetical protein
VVAAAVVTLIAGVVVFRSQFRARSGGRSFKA